MEIGDVWRGEFVGAHEGVNILRDGRQMSPARGKVSSEVQEKVGAGERGTNCNNLEKGFTITVRSN